MYISTVRKIEFILSPFKNVSVCWLQITKLHSLGGGGGEKRAGAQHFPK